MSCIHYKFRSALEYDTITFDGLSISLADLKRSIITQKKFGKNSDFDLEVTNAQTKEEYKDEMTMIPKNSSVVVRRIPVGPKSKAQLAAERSSPFSSGEQKTSGFQDYQVIKSNKLSKVADLANADASEEDKLKAMMKQSGEDWDPSQYVRGRRPYAPGVPLSQSYVCFRCGKPGHFIRNCPTNGDVRFDVPKMKRTTGIPRTFLGTLEDRSSSPTNRSSPSAQGEDSKAKEKGTEPANKKVPSAETGNKKVPSELRCPSCNSLLTDAVLIPCCGTSYCDDCIRNYLLENEQECPSCGAENVSPDSLVINKQLRQAVNTFKNARPASPFPNQAVVTKSTSATSVTVANSTEVKQPQSAEVDTTESASENALSSNKPPESKAVKQINDADNKTKESSPKPVQQVTSQPQQIRVHHRDGPPQQAAGPHPGGVPFDSRRRQGDFRPRGPPRIPEPIIPHGLPPEHVPRVPAVRPGMGGPHHPGPPMKVPNYVPASFGGMHAVAPRPAIPRMPPVPTLVGAPLPPHRPPFGPPMFDPLHHPSDMPRSHTPPMSEREFYKIQKKLKSRTKKKREHSSASSSSRPRKEPKKDGGNFDFDDELSEYRELQKSRQRLRSRSLSPSRSLSRSPSRSRSRSFSRSRSRSRSSASVARSPTPEGWDESRSPSPVTSRSGTASAEEKRRKHKKRKKEQKSKGHKKQKTSHKDEQPSTEQKEETAIVKEEEKDTDKKKRKKQKEKADGIEEEKDKLLEVGKEKVKKDVKATRETEKGKRKEKDKKKLSDKEKGKETEKQSDKKEGKKSKEGKETEKQTDKKEGRKGKEGKEKKKRKDKDKKEESSSGKKRKNKKKHKKHKRHKKEKPKEEKTGDEDDCKNDRLAAKEDKHQDESSDAGNHEEETATDDEKDEHGTDQAELQGESSGSEETERMDKGEREGVGKESDDETLGGLKEIDEEKLLGNESDDDEEREEKNETKSGGNGSDIEGDQREERLLESDKENDEQEAEDKLKGDASDVEEEQRFKGSDEKQLERKSEEESDTDGGRNKEKQDEDGGDTVKGQENRSDKETGKRPIGKTTNGNNERNNDHISLTTTEEENGNHKVEQ